MKLRKIKIKKENKRGAIVDLLIWLVVSFVVVLFFAAWIYGFDRLTDVLVSIDSGNPSVNISSAAQDSFGQINDAQTKGLHTLAYMMIFIMGISILLGNFIVKAHPAFFIVYFLVVIVAIISSVYISNQYELLMTNPVLGTTISEFKGASFIMLFLPIWATVIGIFGMIFLFVGIPRDVGAGGSII